MLISYLVHRAQQGNALSHFFLSPLHLTHAFEGVPLAAILIFIQVLKVYGMKPYRKSQMVVVNSFMDLIV